MDRAQGFLNTAHLYQLGELPTEARHPLTMHLSEWAQKDLKRAIEALVEVDVQALAVLESHIPEILKLREAIRTTLKQRGKIYLCGCGATGRLSLMIESLWREMFPGNEQVIAFMAGGDVALVHSLEGFEDFPQYGARQLLELGFGRRDLLIACTEGGETPYVIGAVEKAAQISQIKPYFLYCNPDEILREKVERSRRVIENSQIEKINLTVGPMALSGSTRMQASTVLQLAVGFALLTLYDEKQLAAAIQSLGQTLKANAAYFLPEFIERESQVCTEGDYVLYSVSDFVISVFTDTTERAPTFSLTPFSHPKAQNLLDRKPSPAYIILPEAKNANDAWKRLLGRDPRPLNWIDIDARTSSQYLENFDFSPQARSFRDQIVGPESEHHFFHIARIEREGDIELVWRFLDVEKSIFLSADMSGIEVHTLLKLLLNIHSTLVMGRLGRYRNNVMTWVYPTNGKLVDRATRYALALLNDAGLRVTYEDAVRCLFQQMDEMQSNESIVLRVFHHFALRDRLLSGAHER